MAGESAEKKVLNNRVIKMSMHRSLRSKSGLLRARNVLSREERIEKLKEGEKWQDESSVFGLPKVKVEAVSLRKKSRDEEDAGEGEDKGLTDAG